jgi:AraC-like DNA-binding protein
VLAAPDHFRARHFRAGEIPHAQRFPAWRSLLNRWLLEAQVEPTGSAPFQAGAYLRVLPDVRFGWGALGGSVYRRTRANVAHDNDDLFLVVNLAGRMTASRRGDEIALSPGDAYLTACSQTGDCGWPDRVELLCIRLKHDAVAPLARNLHDTLGRKIPAANEHLRLLTRYVRLLDDSEPLESAQARALVTRHICDLAALALGAGGDDRAFACERSLHDVRLRALTAHIDRRLSNPTLSLESVATALSVSPRSVQRLFERQGTSFSDFVLMRRLSHAHALLNENVAGDRTIGDIAFASGFGDISWFNRSFRARYGATPSDIRNRHGA